LLEFLTDVLRGVRLSFVLRVTPARLWGGRHLACSQEPAARDQADGVEVGAPREHHRAHQLRLEQVEDGAPRAQCLGEDERGHADRQRPDGP
jgi:hypothetical protein